MSKPWRVTFNAVHESSGIEIINVLHTATDEPPAAGNASAADVADKVAEVCATHYRAMLTTECRLQTIIAAEALASDDNSVPEEAAHTIDAAGTRSASDSSLPLAFCGLINLHTDAAVRSGHGWMFAPPLQSSSALTGSETIDPSSAYWTAMSNFANDLQTEHDIGTVIVHSMRFVVYSQTRRDRGDSQYWFHVTSAVPRARPTWLRSRTTSP